MECNSDVREKEVRGWYILQYNGAVIMVIKSDLLHKVGHSKSQENSCNNLLTFSEQEQLFNISPSFFI